MNYYEELHSGATHKDSAISMYTCNLKACRINGPEANIYQMRIISRVFTKKDTKA